MKLIDRIPLVFLLILAVPLALAPFAPEPHLWQKLKMLAAGSLTRPIDVLDLFWHGVPLALLLAKLARLLALRLQGRTTPPPTHRPTP